jgi:hypothetical protein
LPYLSTFVHKGDEYLGHSKLEKPQGAYAYPSTLKKNIKPSNPIMHSIDIQARHNLHKQIQIMMGAHFKWM